MTRYSVQPRDCVILKGYRFMSFAKNMGRNVGKKISKNVNAKYSQKIFDHAKQYATDAPKTASRKTIEKIAEATEDIIGNKIANQIAKVPKTSPQNCSDTAESEINFLNRFAFTKCINETNNAKVNDAKDLDVVMRMHNLIEYCDNYSKTLGSLCQYYRNKANATLAHSESFKSKIKITGETPDDGNKKDVEMGVPLKYLSNFWSALEMPSINCEGNLILT